ncbi:hypothetical protein [uncultured Chryseobacterium sp.]|uniref:hypothetical protein n=1 Tax=uncultured Chryseobacterium sp. TaxID=259322 RepID=UPI0025E9AF3D|nr:hypothetical protein [uncultured Chryseobacterium sp.]
MCLKRESGSWMLGAGSFSVKTTADRFEYFGSEVEIRLMGWVMEVFRVKSFPPVLNKANPKSD